MAVLVKSTRSKRPSTTMTTTTHRITKLTSKPASKPQSQTLAPSPTFLQISSRNPAAKAKLTPFQTRVYTLLLQIPSGRISTYAAIARALNSSARAVGGACRRNPFAPEVPCHRCVASSGYIGGFMGDWGKESPGEGNCSRKLELLQSEGVDFDKAGILVDKKCWWDEFSV